MFNPQDLNSLLKYCQTLNQDKDDAYDLLYSSIEKYLRKPPKCDAAKFGYIRKIIKNQWIDGLRRFEPDLESITPENQECIGYLINDGNPRRKTTHSANHSSHCLAKSFVQRKAHHLQMGH